MCRSKIELQLRPLMKYFRHWVQKLLNCKSWALWRKGDFLDPFGSRVGRPILSMDPGSPNEEVRHSSPHTSAHSSMRHGRFFDIIEFMCRPVFGLQLRPSLIYFRGWVQKLFNCKSWEAWMSCWTLCRQPRRPPYLIYWTLIQK